MGVPSAVIIPLGSYRDLDALRKTVMLASSMEIASIYFEEQSDSELDPFVIAGLVAQNHLELAVGVLVTLSAGRPPSILAKLTTGIDVTSQGRGRLVLGGSSVELLEDAERYNEAYLLIREMCTQDSTTMAGAFFHVDDAWNRPRIEDRPDRSSIVSIATDGAELLRLLRDGTRLAPVSLVEIASLTDQEREQLVAELRVVDQSISATGVITVDLETTEVLRVPALGLFDQVALRFEALPTREQFISVMSRFEPDQ